MGSLNKILLIGNLGKDAELKYTPGGIAICKFSLATTETWNDKSGQRQSRTEWHNIDLWGKSAESLHEYLTKGKQVYVEGKLATDEWTDKQGVKRRTTKIRADRIVLLGGGGARSQGRRDEEEGHDAQPVGAPAGGAFTDEDIPFTWVLPWIAPVIGAGMWLV